MKNTKDKKTTRAILTGDGQVMIEQANGTYLPAGKGKTDFKKIDAMKDSDINYSEFLSLMKPFLRLLLWLCYPKKIN